MNVLKSVRFLVGVGASLGRRDHAQTKPQQEASGEHPPEAGVTAHADSSFEFEP